MASDNPKNAALDARDLVSIGSSARLTDDVNAIGQATKGLFIKTFGCQMNEYDSEKVVKLLADGYSRVDNPRDADLVIVNTCSVRDKPEQKLYSMLGELAELKQERPGMLIGVGGCVAQQEGNKIIKRNKAVDFVYGTHNISLVPSLISSRQSGNAPQVAVDYRDEWEELPLGFHGSGRVSVFVAISRGCNKNCTYCIVPTTRGVEVSRAMPEILKEIRIAAHRGAREVVLLGQTVNSYGRDLTPKLSFSQLIEEISQIDEIKRIRFVSPHPQEVREDLIELFAKNSKVCRHIHMPLQSGSDRILKAMNRNYRLRRYLEIIDQLRSAAPDIAITTDIIVGFPGESEEDFEQTYAVMEQVRFDGSYSFMFSPRPGTIAAELPDDVPADVKLHRLQRYQGRQDQITREIMEGLVGRSVQILIEGPSRHGVGKLTGRTSQNLTLNLMDEDQSHLTPGMLLPVLVEEIGSFTLRGSSIPEAKQSVDLTQAW